jgi:hypothetical protein
MDKFSMAISITILNRVALFAMTLAQVAGESKWLGILSPQLGLLSNNGRGWNGMSLKK